MCFDAEGVLKAHGYELMAKIGQGAYGRCYRIFSPKYNQTFVCKTIAQKSSFVHELNALMQLDHPNIIKLYDYFLRDNIFYIILEDCVNGNISEYMKKHKVTENQTVKWCYEVIDALNFIHKQGIVHLDIKPSNLLIDKYERIKLADFGVAQPSEIKCENYVGTKYFMAPELFSFEPYDTYAADVWSLGVTLYYVIYQQLPFKNEAQWEIFLERGFKDFPSEVCGELQQCMIRCIQKDPKKKEEIDQKPKKPNILLSMMRSKQPFCTSMLNLNVSMRPTNLYCSNSEARFKGPL